MTGKFFCRGALAPLVALLIAPAAGANLVSNGSFEDGSFSENIPAAGPKVMLVPSTSSAISDWIVVGSGVIADGLAWGENGNSAGLLASEGSRFLDLTGFEDGGRYGVTQDIATEVNKIYELAFDLGSSNAYEIPVAIEASVAGISSIFTSTANGVSQWERVSLQFIALSGSTQISLLGSTGREYIGLDNVSVLEIGAIPIPAAFWLFGSALIALAGFGRKTRFA